MGGLSAPFYMNTPEDQMQKLMSKGGPGKLQHTLCSPLLSMLLAILSMLLAMSQPQNILLHHKQIASPVQPDHKAQHAPWTAAASEQHCKLSV